MTAAPPSPPAGSSTRSWARTAWERLPVPSDRALVRWAVASLISQIGIVVTGGAVRLTGSGLGCPDWPHCVDGSFVSTPEMGINGAIEFGNRLLTFVLGAIALGTLIAVLRTLRSPRPRRDLLVPAIVLLAGIPAQGVIGGITVWTDLNPWVVMFHFMCSATLVAVATVLLRRAQRPGGVAPARTGDPVVRRAAWLTLVVTGVVVYLGTVVTGSGPHSGDPDSHRTGLDLEVVTRVHSLAAYVLVGCTLLLLVLAIRRRAAHVQRAAAVLLALEVAQALLGIVQFRLELPEVLVALHMLGSVLLVVAAVDAVLASRRAPLLPTVAAPA